jgi:hypothetical protein
MSRSHAARLLALLLVLAVVSALNGGWSWDQSVFELAP